MQRKEVGLNLVPTISFTFSSSNIPIHILLRPSADAASCEYAAANVES